MIDPETARQAVQAWKTATEVRRALTEDSLVPAGDALAVLVPQLLDQLAAEETAHVEHLRQGIDWRNERDALGERCRQLEAALEAQDARLTIAVARCYQVGRGSAITTLRAAQEALRAALGDPKETDGRR